MALPERFLHVNTIRTCLSKAHITLVAQKGRSLLLAACVFVVLLRYRRESLFGPNTLAGGSLGRTFDNSVRTVLWKWHQRRMRQEFLGEMGYGVPPSEEETNLVGVPVLTEAWLRETVLASRRRLQEYEAAKNGAHASINEFPTDCTSLPILQPLAGDWYRPLHVTSKMRKLIWVDVSTMDAFMDQHFTSLYNVYERYNTSQRIQLWALCHVALFGGIFLGPTRRSDNGLERAERDCDARQLSIELNGNGEIDVLFAAPNQPHLSCIVRMLSEKAVDGHASEWNDVLSWLLALSSKETRLGSTMLDDRHCERTSQPRFIPLQDLGRNSTLIEDTGSSPGSASSARWKVTFREKLQRSKAPSHQKLPRSRNLMNDRCFPGWLCNRCLRLPLFGSHLACKRWVCPGCYYDSVCNSADGSVHMSNATEIEVEVIETKHSSLKRIPRIIHQTWFEELTSDEYPHLQRLQNSWRSMKGWKYQFYTDEAARDFVRQNFPDVFLDAYDAIQVPAFKADFFRLCVLAMHGGVYADIDVMLDINLDYFISSNLSFFAPRDVNIDMLPNSNYCVWNGLLGSSPGHPIVVKALEDLVNRALQRQDYLDIESELCHRDVSTEVWKLRCSPMLILTGPCALGISLSDAIGVKKPLDGLALGWLRTDNLSSKHYPPDYEWGDVLVLLLDRYDLAELRFTDIGRNLLVASTNQDRIATRPVHDSVSEHKHYSNFESDVVGERAYLDDQISGASVSLRIKHIYE